MGARGDLLGILVLPITTGTEWGKCPALSVVLEGTGECGVLGGMGQRHCQMWQLLCWAFIFSFTVGSSPSDGSSTVKSSRSHNISLESWDGRGRSREKGWVFFFKSCLGFCLPGFFPRGECPTHYFRLVFAFEKFLWNSQTVWGCVRCFCILNPNHLGEKE